MTNNSPYVNIHTHKKGTNELTITTWGVHPYLAESGKELTIEDIDDKVEAIGEIGLDFARPIDKGRQEELFCDQLEVAQQMGLPAVIHSVRAFERTLEILKGYSLEAVIFHGFIGSWQQAQRAIDRGYYLSFGHRCFGSPKTLEALRNTPIEKLFFETDDFDVSIEEIYAQGALHREEEIEEIKRELYKNYINIFKKQ